MRRRRWPDLLLALSAAGLALCALYAVAGAALGGPPTEGDPRVLAVGGWALALLAGYCLGFVFPARRDA